jgi:hypothetical protein
VIVLGFNLCSAMLSTTDAATGVRNTGRGVRVAVMISGSTRITDPLRAIVSPDVWA